MRFSARLDTSHQGPQYPFKHAEIVADSLTYIRRTMVQCILIASRRCIHKGYMCLHRQKSRGFNLASVEATQWVLLYVSIRHDKCY
jgi:hypothetical protein